MKKTLISLVLLLLCVAMLGSCATAVSIDEDGYWVIGGKRTDVIARAEDGRDGQDGRNGADGKDGENGKNADIGDLPTRLGYVSVADFVRPDSGRDVTATLQRVIDENPNRTIYFPDGEYLISATLKTPAQAGKSVKLVFSDYATLKADAKTFPAGAPLLSLGGEGAAETGTETPEVGGADGGIFDCNGVASGMEILPGRQTVVQHCSIKSALVGIRILRGEAGCATDVSDLNITGNNAAESVGIVIEGSGNTLSNVRAGYVTVGVRLEAGGNTLSNVHPLFAMASEQYDKSVGFFDRSGDNYYYYCYSDQYRIGFLFDTGAAASALVNCWSWWWSEAGGEAFALASNGKFNAVVTSLKVGFKAEIRDKNVLVKAGAAGGTGYITDVLGRVDNLPRENTGCEYVRGEFLSY